MKASRFPIALILLLLLLLAGSGVFSLPASWGVWLLPGLAALSLLACLFSREIPLRIWGGGVAILGLLALYAWNPTHRWSEGLGLLPVQHWARLPGSAFPAGTGNALFLAMAMFAAYVLAFRLTERQVSGLQMCVAGGAAILSVVVLSQRLEPNHAAIYETTGLFVNENHFAVCMNMALPLVLALASRARFRAVQEGKPSSPAGLFLLVAVLMGAAIVMSHSRAGVAVMALLVAVYVGWTHRWIHRYPFAGVPTPPFIKVLSGLLVTGISLLAIAAFAREWQQIAGIQREWSFRFGILQDVWASWQAHPWWGTGPGTFSEVFPYYQSKAFQGVGILHAHCEPVQFLSEFGVVGSLWVLLAVGLALSARGASWTVSEKCPPFAELERRAVGLGLAALFLHSLVDFPLRIPLLALMAAAWAGVWASHRPISLKGPAGNAEEKGGAHA